MARGNRRPTRHRAPKAMFGAMRSSMSSVRFGRGTAGRAVRVLRFVSAHRVWGTQ